MYINMTVGQRKALSRLLEDYEYANNSTVQSIHRFESEIALNFYHGRHWGQDELVKMSKIGMDPITINKVATFVDTIVNLQIGSRKSITFKSSTNFENYQNTANNIKYLWFKVQHENRCHDKGTAKFSNVTQVGTGWSELYYDNECKKFIYNNIDFREMIPDPDDQTIRMEKQNRTFRHRFLPILDLIIKYPKYKSYFEQRLNDSGIGGSNDTSYLNKNFLYSSGWFVGKSAKIVEVYYKKVVKYYRTYVNLENPNANDGFNMIQKYYSTFDKEDAKERKADEAPIEELYGTQIWRGVFNEDILFEHAPIVGQIPNQQFMPFLPTCVRRDDNGVPYGEIRNLISPARLNNRIYTQLAHSLDSRYLIVDSSLDPSKLKQSVEAFDKKRAVIPLNNPKDVQLFTQEAILPYMHQTLNRLDVDNQQITQLYEEARGEQSNATSGVAIDKREKNTIRMQNIMADAYNYMLFSEGQLFLDTLKGLKNFKYNFVYEQDDNIQEINLDDSLSLIDFEIYQDTAAPYISNVEENAAKFKDLISSPNAQMILASSDFIQELGIDEVKSRKINTAFRRDILGQGQPQEEEQTNR